MQALLKSGAKPDVQDEVAKLINKSYNEIIHTR